MATAVDSSGNGRHGTYDGSPDPTDGAVVGDGAAHFATSASRVLVPNSGAFTLSPPFTVELWARLDVAAAGSYYSPAGSRQDIATGRGMTRGWNFYHVGSSTPDATLRPPPGWQFWTGNGNTTADVTAWNRAHGGVATAGTWYYLVGVATAGLTSLYVDGAFAGSEAGTVVGLDGNTPVGIGVYANENGTVGAGVGGDVDEVAIFDRALTAGEIAARYALRGSSSAYRADVLADAPLGYWRLDDLAVSAGWSVGGVRIG